MIPVNTFILTSEGLTNLALLLLTAAFFIFLVQRRPYSLATRWLLGHEASLAVFLAAQFFDTTTFLPFWYGLMYLGFVTGMACLLQFSSAFPQPITNTRTAVWFGALSGTSILIELMVVGMFWLTPHRDQAGLLRMVGIGLGLWQIIAAMVMLAYQTARFDEAKRPWWLSLILPRALYARAARNMLLAILAIGSLAVATLVYRLWLQRFFSEAFFNIAWNIGLMLLISLFSITYLVNTPDRVSFQTKLVLGTLVAVLVSVWLLSLIYPFQIQITHDLKRQSDMEAVQSWLKNESPVQFKDAIPSAVTFIAECDSASTDVVFIRKADIELARVCSDDFLVGGMYLQGANRLPIIVERFNQDQKNYAIGFSYAGYFDTINKFTLPIALVMMGSTLIIMLLLPLVFYNNLGKPLGALMDGLRQINQKRLDVTLPIQANDEIGMLTQSFNTMAADLQNSVTDLQNQIAESLKAEKSLREQQEQFRALAARLAEVEEAERKKLGRELHDQAGQNLTALSLNLKLVRTQLAASANNPMALAQLLERLNDAAELVHQTTLRIRNVMEDLQPPALEEFGLAAALRWYASHYTARTNILVEISSPEPCPRRTPQVEIALFRVAQEALTNVARHAQATRVDIQIELKDDLTRMNIHDNGLGFDPSQPAHVEERSHWGLRIMAERAEAVGGTFCMASTPNMGTQITVEVAA